MKRIPFTFTILGTLLHLAPFSMSPVTQAADQADSARTTVELKVNRPDGVCRVGDRLRVSLKSKVDGYVYVLYHQSNGEAVLSYPTCATGTAAVSAGSRIDITGDEEGVEIRISKPHGREILQVLVARRPLMELENLIDYRARAYPVLRSKQVDRYCEQLYADMVLLDDPRVEVQTIAGYGHQSRGDEPPMP